MMDQMIEAYPLSWPISWPRSRGRQSARFKTAFASAVANVRREVELMGGERLIISSNVPLRRDGLPSAKATYVADPGVAVYFERKKDPLCFPCDVWDAVDDNMQAVAKTIEALRGIKRWGSVQLADQAYKGFLMLPAPEPPPWQILGVSSTATEEEIQKAHRRLAFAHHPDRPGGDEQQMSRINTARAAMLGQ